MKRILNWFGVMYVPAGHAEKLVAGLGGLTALGALAVFNDFWNGSAAALLLLTSMGSSIVVLFAAPHAAGAQPWPLLGGHLVSATLAVASALLLDPVMLAAPVAIALAITAMYYLRCMHPPGGATAVAAVAAVHQGAGFSFVVDPVLISALVLLGVAVVFNYPFPWRRYPAALVQHRASEQGGGLSEDDIRYALKNVRTFMDVSTDDVAELYRLAQEHAALEREFPEGSVCCVARGTGAMGLVEGLERCADGPVFYKVMSTTRPDGKPVLVWSKYQVDPDKATAADDAPSVGRS